MKNPFSWLIPVLLFSSCSGPKGPDRFQALEPHSVVQCNAGTTLVQDHADFGCVDAAGTREGAWYIWNSNNREWEHGPYHSGRKEGPWEEFRDGPEYLFPLEQDPIESRFGWACHKGSYHEGRREGHWELGYTGGDYVHGTREGRWVVYTTRWDKQSYTDWEGGVPDYVRKEGVLSRAFDLVTVWIWFLGIMGAIFLGFPAVALGRFAFMTLFGGPIWLAAEFQWEVNKINEERTRRAHKYSGES